MSTPPPMVSVVIPTLRRPNLVRRAVDSVFAQTHPALEVIVVVDGPDEDTVAVLHGVDDPRLRFFVNPNSLTAAGARNFGVAQARGEWIAFLDDDDEWLPTKLERQLDLARSSGTVLVTALSKVITPLSTYVWPREIFDNTQPVGNYLFDRRSIFAGASFIQTSSYLLPRALMQQVPFRVGTPHDDWDFLLRLAAQPGMRILTVPEVLVKVYFEQGGPSLSRADSWSLSLAWVDEIRPLLTPRAYSGFCLAVVGPRAADEGGYSAFLPLLSKAFAQGRPRLRHVLAFLGFWVLPQGARRRLRAIFGRRRNRLSKSIGVPPSGRAANTERAVRCL
jgi:glycosyltransferase involved in cell wall biosynthesis